MKWVRGPGSGQGCWANKGAVAELEESRQGAEQTQELRKVHRGALNACVFVSLEHVVCAPSLLNFHLYQPERRNGTRLSVCLFYMKAVGSSPLAGAACVTSHVSVMSVCVYLYDSGIGVQLCYWLNLQRGKRKLCFPGWAETLHPQALV